MNPAHIVLIEYNPGDILPVEMALKENDIPYKLTQFDNGLEALRVLCESATADPLVPDARAAEIGSFERTSTRLAPVFSLKNTAGIGGNATKELAISRPRGQ